MRNTHGASYFFLPKMDCNGLVLPTAPPTSAGYRFLGVPATCIGTPGPLPEPLPEPFNVVSKPRRLWRRFLWRRHFSP